MNSGSIDQLQQNNTDKIKFAVTDIDGVLRGKIINMNKFLKSMKTDAGFCNVVFGNRTTALRVINHVPAATKLETRVPGADANPYLSLAASLASGLYGIKNKLALELDAVKGSAYDNKSLQQLPSTLQEATVKMKTSNIATEIFGKAFVDHFIRTRKWEWQQFSKQVTDRELKRYFEII